MRLTLLGGGLYVLVILAVHFLWIEVSLPLNPVLVILFWALMAGMALDFAGAVESARMRRHYEGFLGRGAVKRRREPGDDPPG